MDSGLSGWISCRGTALACLLFPLPVAAVELGAILVEPAQVRSYTNVTLTLHNDSPGSCGAVVSWGDNLAPQAMLIGNAPEVLTHAYTAAGRYQVQVSGLQLPLSPRPPCGNTPQQASVTVTDTRAAPAGQGDLRPQPPHAAPAPDTALSALNPLLQSVEFTPALVDNAPFTMAEGILAPGGQLTVRGAGFGNNTGVIRMNGLPGGAVPLMVHEWSDTLVVATIPETTGGALGTRYLVELTIYNIKAQRLGGGQFREYERPSDTVLLHMDDPAVVVLSCGPDGNLNHCNRATLPGDGCGVFDIGPVHHDPPQPLPTIWGYHENCAGAIGDDHGTDRYRIHLDNGWFLLKVVSQDLAASSGDERLSTLPFRPGRTDDGYDIEWTASPGDSVEYRYNILIRGPRGTPHR